MIESPSVYGHLTATENLKVWQSYFRCADQRIPKVLETVGLATTGSKKAGQFSLGMKQRLGIAIALLHQPSLLILDEPTNGLDPEGIIEIRTLLQQLNQEEGITILVSSHLLSEIEKLVSHLGIINKGRLVFQGRLEELSQQQNKFSRLCIATNDNERAATIILQSGLTGQIEGEKIFLPIPSKEQIAELNFNLTKAGLSVYELQVNRVDLETIFIDLINQPL
jgi:ABC-2 type transport system ATP-binding protein